MPHAIKLKDTNVEFGSAEEQMGVTDQCNWKNGEVGRFQYNIGTEMKGKGKVSGVLRGKRCEFYSLKSE